MRKKGLIILAILMALQLTGCDSDKHNENSINSKAVNPKAKNSSEKPGNGSNSLTEELAKRQKADYLEVLAAIQTKYVYLEDKLGMTREEFRKKELAYAETVNWGAGKNVFIDEVRKLRAKFPDGHFGWNLAEEYKPFSGIKYLGFTPTLDQKGRILVGKTYEGLIGKDIQIGDEILTWNGKPVRDEIQRLGELIPQSTELGTKEKACRYLTVEMGMMPLREKLEAVQATFRKPDGREFQKTLNWLNCDATTQTEEYFQDAQGTMVLFTKGMLPSLESIPKDAEFPHPRLALYFEKAAGKTYAVLHPRSFSDFTVEDLNKVMTEVKKHKVAALVVDLKDSAGGYFDQVLYLAHSLNVKKPFSFELTEMNSELNQKIKSKEDFKELEAGIKNPTVWTGKVYFRINPITVSGGDYFTRWMKLNHRGKIFGSTTAGAGAGTDTIELKNSKTEISIPMRDRHILGDPEKIEGKGTSPDVFFDGEINAFMKRELK